jgi:hypothetical protein
MNYKKYYEDAYQKSLKHNSVWAQVADLYGPAKKRTFKQRVRNLLSYLTRYQIVDTWTMHDNCDY